MFTQNLKQSLKEKAFTGGAEKYLWIPPSLPYYEMQGAYKNSKGFSKILAFRLIYLYLPLYAISHITVAVSVTLISSASISISYAPGALISHSVHSINLISFNGFVTKSISPQE